MALTAEQQEKILARLKIYLPGEDCDLLLLQLIEDAADFVQDYTYRTEIPDVLMRPVGDLALIAFNRRGTEGESARSEGGESYTFEAAPHGIYSVLNRYRLARVGGAAYEKAKTDED